ncbi:MAG: hypothetical protein M3R61_04170 [Chloroflexota bacterium]|nr:hypothetical protein [Chloroflexota bacterium]
MLVNKSPTTTYRATVDLQGFSAAAPVRIWRHDQQTPGTASDYGGPLAPLDIRIPPYSTTMLVIPARPGLSTPLIWAGAGAAALLAGLAAWRLRRGGARARNADRLTPLLY